MKHSSLILFTCLAIFSLNACETTQGNPIFLSAERYTPYMKDHPISVFRSSDLPKKPYTEIAIIDVTSDVWAESYGNLDAAIEILKNKCRLIGGDAIIKIKENNTGHFETKTYHVTARAIRYTK